MIYESTFLEKIALTCGICHDQCAAACPVVESSRSLAAYPSRLAMLAWELSRGNLSPDSTLMSAMQNCIHCNACTSHCVYVDQPVDITHLVRRARQHLITAGWATPAMQDLAAQSKALRDPGSELHRRLRSISDLPVRDNSPQSTLVLVDAATLTDAPGMVEDALRLLAALGWQGLRVAPILEYGRDLFEYGFLDEARGCALEAVEWIERDGAQDVLTISTATAHLLREIYPTELAINLSARVRTIPEAVLATVKPGLFHTHPQDRALLVHSATETNKLKDQAALEILKTCCTVVNDPLPANLFLRQLTYPDGLALDLHPDPRHRIMARINQYMQVLGANRAVTTDAGFLKDFQALGGPTPVGSLYSYLLDSL